VIGHSFGRDAWAGVAKLDSAVGASRTKDQKANHLVLNPRPSSDLGTAVETLLLAGREAHWRTVGWCCTFHVTEVGLCSTDRMVRKSVAVPFYLGD